MKNDAHPSPIFPGNPAKLSGRRVTVMGLGSFGGGVAAAEYLLRQGTQLTVTDAASEESLTDSLAQLDRRRLVRMHLGGHEEQDFADAELLVVNPAVKPENRWVQFAIENKIPTTTEFGLLWNELGARGLNIAAVTGSNGKSTTTALLHAILQANQGSAWLGGNLGGSLLPRLSEMRAGDWAVLEVSSFQLHYLRALTPAPQVAVVTNFSPNHLDWHQNIEHYRESKQLLLANQDFSGVAVLNADDPESRDWPAQGERRLFGLAADDHLLINGKPLDWPVLDWTGLKGRHHLANIAAAMTAAQAIGIPLEQMEQGLRSFQPLPHRLQNVGELEGRTFYNDSLATTPESAIAALQAMDRPIILLAGGADKGSDLTPFAREMHSRAKTIILMGDTAIKLEELLQKQTRDEPHWVRAESFEHAMNLAWESSASGDVILLSPGCASYGWFRDFRERGDRFVAEFERLQNLKGSLDNLEESSGC